MSNFESGRYRVIADIYLPEEGTSPEYVGKVTFVVDAKTPEDIDKKLSRLTQGYIIKGMLVNLIGGDNG